jgi:polyisoprenoid-binding protein YceI
MMLRKVVFATGVVAGLGLASTQTSLAAGGTYNVDKVHSTVVFRVKHMNASFAYGRFNDISGQFAFDDQDPAQSHFEFVVKADSVDTANPQRDQHLKSPDFFNAVQFPTITFKSKSVANAGPEAFQVTGDLTFHGVTKPISFKLTRSGSGKDFQGKAIAGFEAAFWIKRSEFKMSPKMIGPVGDDVLVTVSVEGAQ